MYAHCYITLKKLIENGLTEIENSENLVYILYWLTFTQTYATENMMLRYCSNGFDSVQTISEVYQEWLYINLLSYFLFLKPHVKII